MEVAKAAGKTDCERVEREISGIKLLLFAEGKVGERAFKAHTLKSVRDAKEREMERRAIFVN